MKSLGSADRYVPRECFEVNWFSPCILLKNLTFNKIIKIMVLVNTLLNPITVSICTKYINYAKIWMLYILYYPLFK